jgi:hypothetical protein
MKEKSSKLKSESAFFVSKKEWLRNRNACRRSKSVTLKNRSASGNSRRRRKPRRGNEKLKSVSEFPRRRKKSGKESKRS